MPSAKKEVENAEKSKSPPPSNPKKSRKRQKEPEKEVPVKKPDQKLNSSSIDMDAELLEDQIAPSIIIQEDNTPSRLDLKKVRNSMDKADGNSSKSKSLLGS